MTDVVFDGKIGNVQPPPAPAEPGNTRALQHGAHSDRLVAPEARELAGAVLDAHAHLDPVRDAGPVARYATLLARIARAEAWLARQADPLFADAERGVPHSLVNQLDRWSSRAAAAERRLGLDPQARAALGLTKAATAAVLDPASALSAARRESDPAIRRALLAQAGVVDVESDGAAHV